jgi:drug/metabolite transporter (DMT)-like permease
MNSYEREIERQKQQQYSQIMKRLTGPLLLSGAACLFGTIPEIQQNTFDFIPPWTFVWVRYVIALVTLGIIVRITRKSNTLDDSRARDERTSGFSSLFAVAFTGYFATAGGSIAGTRVTTLTEASLLDSCVPVLLFLFGILLLRERFEFTKLTAFLLSIFGASICILKDGKYVLDFAPTNRLGDFWLLLSCVMLAYQAVILKRSFKQVSPLVITFYSFAIAVVLITPLMLIELWKLGKLVSIWRDLLSGDVPTDMILLYLGIFATAAAYYMWTRGLLMTDLSTGCIVMYFQLIVEAVIRWFFHYEPLGTSFLVGGIVLIISMYWMLREPGEQSAQTDDET